MAQMKRIHGHGIHRQSFLIGQVAEWVGTEQVKVEALCGDRQMLLRSSNEAGFG